MASRFISSIVHLDDEYQGETRDIHQVALAPTPGPHVLVLVDERGETVRAGRSRWWAAAGAIPLRFLTGL